MLEETNDELNDRFVIDIMKESMNRDKVREMEFTTMLKIEYLKDELYQKNQLISRLLIIFHEDKQDKDFNLKENVETRIDNNMFKDSCAMKHIQKSNYPLDGNDYINKQSHYSRKALMCIMECLA